MAVETELKLRITPEHMRRLKRHPAFKSLLASRATTRKLHNVYFDTPQMALHARGMALRLRRSGNTWLQTLKGGGGVMGGLHQRDEWETPVQAAALDLTQLSACGAPALPRKIRTDLRPVFNTDFTRSSYLLDYEDAQIELCMDSGEIQAGDAKLPISELELELKSGEPRLLYKLALLLLDIVPLEVEHCSKAEYGYRLFTQMSPGVAKYCLPQLKRSMSPAAALREMIWPLLQQLQANIQGALISEDEEYLHQVRVTLRRLRVALGIGKLLLGEDAELVALCAELKSLFRLLGQAREWDVFLTQILAELRTHFPDHSGLAKLAKRGEVLRQSHHEAVCRALQAPGFQGLMLRIAMWLHEERWQDLESLGMPSLLSFSARILRRCQRRVKRCGGKLLQTNSLASDKLAHELHALRLACKKLRYNAELFSSLRAQEKQKLYMANLARLQDTLGQLNDIAVARRLLKELAEGGEGEDLVRGWLEREYKLQYCALYKSWKVFSKQIPCW